MAKHIVKEQTLFDPPPIEVCKHCNRCRNGMDGGCECEKCPECGNVEPTYDHYDVLGADPGKVFCNQCNAEVETISLG